MAIAPIRHPVTALRPLTQLRSSVSSPNRLGSKISVMDTTIKHRLNITEVRFFMIDVTTSPGCSLSAASLVER